MESVNKFCSGREGMKARDIEKKYPPEKAKQLIAALTARNLYYYDEDFPDDREDYVVQKIMCASLDTKYKDI